MKEKTVNIQDKEIINNILSGERITQTFLAEKIGITRQYLCNVVKGNKGISSTTRTKLREFYPSYFKKTIVIPKEINNVILKNIRKSLNYSQAEFAKELYVSQSLIAQCESNPNRTIPQMLIDKLQKFSDSSTVSTAIKLAFSPEITLTSSFELNAKNKATEYVDFDKRLLPNDTNYDYCEIVTLNDYKVIIDWSKKSFIDNKTFVFRVNNKTYVASVEQFPNKTKCTTIAGDTFDLIGEQALIYGMIIPNIRL